MNLVNLYNRHKPSYYKAFKDLSIHVGMVTSTLYAMWYTKESYESYLFVPLLALLQVRTFIIFHDCGHNSFTPNKQLNNVIGSLLGIMMLTPFSWALQTLLHVSGRDTPQHSLLFPLSLWHPTGLI